MTQLQRDASPSAVIRRFATCLNEGDVDGALELYDEDAVFAVQPGQVVRGQTEIRRALEGFAAMSPRLTGEIVKVLETTDHAVVFNAWTLQGTSPDGSPIEMGATSADVLRRGPDGRWRVLIDDPWGA
jgi:uncharacterized protein (TIGR02246 family)